jgi:hypothetical protein
MKKNILSQLSLILAFASFLSLNLTSQVTVSITPATVNMGVNTALDETIAKASMRNTSSVTKRFTWQRTIVNITPGWTTLVCDSQGCWTAAQNTAPDPIELMAGQSGNLDAYIRPARLAGSATIDIKVTEIGNTANTATVRYVFSTSTAVKNLRADDNLLRVYPNPSVDHFSLPDNSGVSRVVVYNIIGRQVKSYAVQDGQRYNVADIPDGIYIVRLLGANGATLKTIRLNKARARA